MGSKHSSIIPPQQQRNTQGAHCDMCGTVAAAKPPVDKAQRPRCSRCHRGGCSACLTSRLYSSRVENRRSLVCPKCDHRSNRMLLCMPRSAWLLIQGFCCASARNSLLQLCRTTQMGVALPYVHDRLGWSSFFTDRQFLSKGADGSVYKTSLRPDIADRMGIRRKMPIHGRDDVSLSLPELTVAVKSIRKSEVHSLWRWERIHREIEALRRCRHKYVTEFLFAAQGPSEVYIVLQFVGGGDLFNWLVRQQVPQEEDVAVVARQLLEALDFMHACGVVHRDIKPENILLEQQQQQQSSSSSCYAAAATAAHDDEESYTRGERLHIRIADFGYAKVLSSAPSWAAPTLPPSPCHVLQEKKDSLHGFFASHDIPTTSTHTHTVSHSTPPIEKQLISATPCGTFGFAAPEILSAYNAYKEAPRFRGDAEEEGPRPPATPLTSVELIKRIDIFAAGVTISILLTGCEPFPCLSSRGHLDAVRCGVDFSGPQWSHVSRPAKRLLRKMLAPLAADRPSAQECLRSTWLSSLDLLNDLVVVPDSDMAMLATSFRNSVSSLRRGDGLLFVQDAATGLVSTVPRGARTS